MDSATRFDVTWKERQMVLDRLSNEYKSNLQAFSARWTDIISPLLHCAVGIRA